MRQLFQNIVWLVALLSTLSCNIGKQLGPTPPKSDTQRKDRGIGLMVFSANVEFSDTAASMYILREPSIASQVVATFIREITPDQGFRYVVPQLPTNAYVNTIEYGPEAVGLPFDDTTQHWCRAIYGMMESGIPLKGWVLLTPTFNENFFWADELPKHNLFFSPEPEIAEFFDRPEGNRISFALESSYIMYPLQRENYWLRVRVVTPSNLCDDPPIIATGDFWIQYVDVTGKPLVFYYTRGC